MKSSELFKKFQKGGWNELRQSGSHKIMQHAKKDFTISLPWHGSKEVPTGTANKLLKQAGLK